MWNMLKPFLARFITKYIFALAGGILVTLGITEDSLYNIIFGILGLIISGGIDVSQVIKAIKTPAPK